MRVLICGDRNWSDFDTIFQYLSKLPKDTVVIEGEARGADSMAREAARLLGLRVEPYPADWEKHGRAAGPIRNKEMLLKGRPDLVVAFHENIATSKGTKNMVDQALKAGIKTAVLRGSPGDT